MIFATSCRFIDRNAFIDFVSRFIPDRLMRGLWEQFWLYCGIFVVKGYHVAEFALLTWLAYAALRNVPRVGRRRALAAGAAMALLYAVSDEWHQTFVPGRGGTATDVLIDTLGIAGPVVLACWRAGRRRCIEPAKAE